ncbi:MAG: radical SAM protein [Nanoarchaeota archaeon]
MKHNFHLAKYFLLSKLKNLPFKLNFSITDKCNSNCITCNIWKYKDYKNELKLWEIRNIFRKFSPALCWLTLTGGEPFLRNDFISIIDTACEELPNLRLISIPSNGMDQKKIISDVKKVMDLKINIYITFSLDGPPEVHDEIRGVSNSFKKTWGTYIKVKELTKNNKHIKVGLETTISDKNIDSLPPFIKKIKNHESIISIAHNSHVYKNENDKILFSHQNIKKIRNIIEMAGKQYSFFSFESAIKKIYLKNIPDWLGKKSKIMPCTALNNSVYIDSCGKVAPCPMWGFVVGDLRTHNYDIMNLWDSKRAHIARKLINMGKCCSCWTPCEAYQSIVYNWV